MTLRVPEESQTGILTMVIDIEKMFNFNYRFSKIKTVIINFNSKRCFQREVDSLCLIEVVLNRLILLP